MLRVALCTIPPMTNETQPKKRGCFFYGCIALIVAVAKMVDLWRRRRRERAALRGVITDALLAEPRLVDSMVVAKVRIPFWEGTPATVVLTGRVPDADAHAVASRVTRAAAASVRPDVTVQDLLREGRERAGEHAA